MLRFKKNEKLPGSHEPIRHQRILIGRNLVFARLDQISGLDTRPFVVVDVIQALVDLFV